MHLIVQQTTNLSGQLTVPSSKSQSIRAILLATLCHGVSTIDNVLDSDDTQDAIRVCQLLGAQIDRQGDRLLVSARGLPLQPISHSIFTGNSGITTRFVMPLLGLCQQNQPMILDCGEQMRARPIHSLVDALRQLGLNCRYLAQEGVCPLEISGSLMGGKTAVAGITSQYLSALLLSLPCANQESEITVLDLHERPYINMTLNWLREQGIHYHQQTIPASNTGEKGSVTRDIFHIPGNQRYHPFHKAMEGDFSSASYLIASAALIPGQVTLEGLNMQDAQGDKRLVMILQEMGADIRIEPTQLIIRGGKPLRGIRIDANEIPDLLPTLAVLGTQARGTTEIYHVQQARIKETDRIHSMTQGLTRMGIHVKELPDGMIVSSGKLHGAVVQGFGDHRTVMALAMAGLLANGETQIDDALAMTKTFPGFVKVMQSLGAKMELRHA